MTPEAQEESGDRHRAFFLRKPDGPLLGWAAIGALVCAVMAPLEPSLLEEGLILHLAERMVEGERLFVDLASFTGPFPFEVLAFLFRLFGAEIAVARAVIVVLSGASCAVVFSLARQVGLRNSAHVAAAAFASGPVFLFPLHSTYFYSTIAYHLVLISVYAGLRGARCDRWAVFAGALAAFAVLTKQSVGLVIAPTLVLAVLLSSPQTRRWRATGATVLGGAAVAVITVAYYGATGALRAMVDSLVFLPLTFEEAFGSAFINFWPPGEFSPELSGQAHFYTPFVYSLLRGAVLKAPSFAMTLTTQALYAAPLLALVATGLRRLRGPMHPAIWFHAAALLALVSNLFPRTDWGHLVYCLAPAVVQLLLLVPVQEGPSRALRRGAAGAGMACLLAGALYVGVELWKLSGPPNLGSRVPLRVVSRLYQAPALARVVRFLEERVEPGEAIFVPRSEPLIYFATHTRNPTPYSGVIPGILDEEEEAIVAALEDVRFVVMSEIDQPVFTVYRDLLPGVAAYLERYFELPLEFQKKGYGWIVVYQRRGDRGETAIDLFDLADEAHRWVRVSGDGDASEIQIAEAETPLLATSRNRRPLPIWMDAWGGGIDYEIQVPESGVFQADVGLARIRGYRPIHPMRVTFSLSLSTGGAFETVASREVLHDASEGNHWTPFEADLSAHAGRRVVLRLEVMPEKSLPKPKVAWWGSPRVVCAGCGSH